MTIMMSVVMLFVACIDNAGIEEGQNEQHGSHINVSLGVDDTERTSRL